MNGLAGSVLRVLGAIALPTLIVDCVCKEETLFSIATGGEWLRLNSSTYACFGAIPRNDHKCRHPLEMDCMASSNGCLWAATRAPRCAGSAECVALGTSSRSCARAGCNFTRPLDARLSCSSLDMTSSLGGARCEAIQQNKPEALPLVRAELRATLLQIFLFLVANHALLTWYGGIDALVRDGKPWLLGTFLLVAIAGQVRRSLVDHGELRWV